MDGSAVKLTPKQQLFVLEYLKDLNATQASIRAGYSAKTAEQQGPRLLGNVGVATAIQEAMDKRVKKIEIDGDKVLQEVAKLSFSDIRGLFDEQGRLLPIHQLSPEISASISSVKVVTKTIPGTDPVEVEHVSEFKFWDKRGSLELLGKHLKLWADVGSKDNPLTMNIPMVVNFVDPPKE